MTWTKSPTQDFNKDNRGWKKGKPRKYTKADEKRIKNIHKSLKRNSKRFYSGVTAILQEYIKRHPKLKPPTLRFIGRTLSKYGLSDKRRIKRNTGASHYLHYPEYSIAQIGKKLLEIDFIGKKFIKGRTEPINFIAFSFKQPRKLKHFQRIESETANEVIKHSRVFFRKFGKPDVVKMDNGFAFYGSGSAKRSTSKAIKFFLKERIIPVFAPPRKPWSQASVEGSNSVFTRKFWNKLEFRNLQEIDEKLKWFNRDSERYSAFKPFLKTKQTFFKPSIYFIRKIYEDEQSGKGFIDILNEKIFLPKSYINLFVLSEWNLKQEQLYIYFEKEQELKMIKKLQFKINQRSREGVLFSFVH